MYADWLHSRSGAICNAGQRSCGLTHFFSAGDLLRSDGNLTVYVFCDHLVKKDYFLFLFAFGNEGHIHSRLRGAPLVPSTIFVFLFFFLPTNNVVLLRGLRPEVGDPPSTMADNKHPRVIFCNDSPKRVLVSVIKTTPIKPRKAEDMTPTSPGFSDFMVYPWKWGENAHNVTLSPGSTSEASSPTGTQTAGEADTAPSPDQLRVSLTNFENICNVV